MGGRRTRQHHVVVMVVVMGRAGGDEWWERSGLGAHAVAASPAVDRAMRICDHLLPYQMSTGGMGTAVG